MPAYQWWGAIVCEEEAGELKSVALKVKSVAADTCIKAVKSVMTSMAP